MIWAIIKVTNIEMIIKPSTQYFFNTMNIHVFNEITQATSTIQLTLYVCQPANKNKTYICIV